MIRLVANIRAVCRVDGAEAKKTAANMIQFLETMVHAGEEIDLGFIKLQPRTVKPAEIKFNLDPKKKDRHFLGERVRWKVHFIRGWLKKTRPVWSKY